MLKRLKNLWELSKYEPALDRTFDLTVINDEVRSNGPVLRTYIKKDEELLGDGSAVFFPLGDNEEYERHVHEEQQGWGKYYKRWLGK